MRLRFAHAMMLAFALLASACSGNGDKPKGKATAKSQSAPYELLIVAKKDWLKTQTGEALQNAVSPSIEGLPQNEPSFRVTSINPSAFNSTFKVYAKIVMVDINKKYAKPNIEYHEDVYCKPQIIATIVAPDDASLLQYLNTDAVARLLDVMNEQEFKRERRLLAKHYSGKVKSKAKEMFGIDIFAPKDIDDVKVGKDFLWGSASKQEFRLNVCVYSLPLVDIDVEAFVQKRDSVMKINIPGGREDQWMETDGRTVTARIAKHDGMDVLEVRGLWSMRNDAMGGPFVSYVQADQKNNRLVVTEGFVFAPEEKKRPLIRILEAMLQTAILK